MSLSDKPYYIYVIRCEDNSLYTGITTDIDRRFKEHIEGKKTGAKYTRAHKPISIEAVWQCEDKSSALKLEYALKKLSKDIKEAVIKVPDSLKDIFAELNIKFKLYNKKSTG